MADLAIATGLASCLRLDRFQRGPEKENKANESKQRSKQFSGDWIHNEKGDANSWALWALGVRVHKRGKNDKLIRRRSLCLAYWFFVVALK
jgi:hypothetical protein